MRISLINGNTLYPLAGQAGVAESAHSSAGGFSVEADIAKQTALRVRADNAEIYDRSNLLTTLSFSTVRTFSTPAAAEAWALDYDATYPRAGTLVLSPTGVTGGERYLGGTVLDPPARQVLGCSVALTYTATGGAIGTTTTAHWEDAFPYASGIVWST